MRVSTIDKIINSISSSIGEYINIPKVFKILVDKYITYPELKDDLLKEFDEAIKKKEEADKNAQAEKEAQAQVEELTAKIAELEEELRNSESSQSSEDEEDYERS